MECDKVLRDVYSAPLEDPGAYSGVLDVALKNFENVRASKWFNSKTNKTTISLARGTVQKLLSDSCIDPETTNVYEPTSGQLNLSLIIALQFEYIHKIHTQLNENTALINNFKGQIDKVNEDMSAIRRTFADIDARVNNTITSKIEVLTSLMKPSTTAPPQESIVSKNIIEDINTRIDALQDTQTEAMRRIEETVTSIDELNKNQDVLDQNNKTILKYIEDLRAPVDMISQSAKQMNLALESTQAEVQTMGDQIDSINHKIENMKTDMDAKEKFTSDTIVQLHKNINDITNDLTGITRQASETTMSELGLLFKRVARLEADRTASGGDSLNVSQVTTSTIKRIKPLVDHTLAPM
jgi:predicted  nucleic acid-binding Zn-ribbon protein